MDKQVKQVNTPTTFEMLEQLQRVAENIRDQKLNFNMSFWRNDTECGTTFCLLGWASRDKWFQNNYQFKWSKITDTAYDLDVVNDLGLTKSEFQYLFYSLRYKVFRRAITIDDVLRHIGLVKLSHTNKSEIKTVSRVDAALSGRGVTMHAHVQLSQAAHCVMATCRAVAASSVSTHLL